MQAISSHYTNLQKKPPNSSQDQEKCKFGEGYGFDQQSASWSQGCTNCGRKSHGASVCPPLSWCEKRHIFKLFRTLTANKQYEVATIIIMELRV